MLVKRFNHKEEVLSFINSDLGSYRGYVQFSHRPLKSIDIFEESDPCVAIEEEGFVYEAHFCNGNNSIMIRQINEAWIVSKTSVGNVKDEEIAFYALEKTKHLKKVKSNWVKMAQIWEMKPDALCEDMEVMNLQKVVFVGFALKKPQGES